MDAIRPKHGRIWKGSTPSIRGLREAALSTSLQRSPKPSKMSRARNVRRDLATLMMLPAVVSDTRSQGLRQRPTFNYNELCKALGHCQNLLILCMKQIWSFCHLLGALKAYAHAIIDLACAYIYMCVCVCTHVGMGAKLYEDICI